MINRRRRWGPFTWHRADCFDKCPVWILSIFVDLAYVVFNINIAFGRHKNL